MFIQLFDINRSGKRWCCEKLPHKKVFDNLKQLRKYLGFSSTQMVRKTVICSGSEYVVSLWIGGEIRVTRLKFSINKKFYSCETFFKHPGWCESKKKAMRRFVRKHQTPIWLFKKTRLKMLMINCFLSQEPNLQNLVGNCLLEKIHVHISKIVQYQDTSHRLWNSLLK